MKRDELEQQIDLGLRGLSRSSADRSAADDDAAAPDMHAVWTAAHTRAASLRRRNTMRNTTLMLLLAGLLTVAGLTLWPRGNGWAVTDGWIVEYEIEVPAYYGFDIIGRGVQGVETPQSRLERLVHDWSTEHADRASVSGTELATLSIGQPSPQFDKDDPQNSNFFVHRAGAQLTFMSDDAVLLEELLKLLRSPGNDLPPLLGEVKKYSKTWITREKFPELYEPAVLWINAEQYVYPQDFKEQRDIETLAGILPRNIEQARMRPEGRGSMLYYNLFSVDVRSRTGLGVLCRLDYTERGLEISAVDDRGEFDALVIDPPDVYFAIQMGGTFDSKGQPVDNGFTLEDYRAILLNQLKESSAVHESEFVSLEVWQLKYLLFPASRFAPGQPAALYAVSSEDKENALVKWARYKAAFDKWLAQHPECALSHGSPGHASWVKAGAGGELLGPFIRGTKYFDQPMWCFDATLTGLSQAERDELKTVLDRVDPDATSFAWRVSDLKVPREDLEAGDAPR